MTRLKYTTLYLTLLAVLAVFAGVATPALAFFGDRENGTGEFVAGRLDAVLVVLEAGNDSRSVRLASDSSEEFSYRVSTEADAASAFCRELSVRVEREGVEIYEGALADFELGEFVLDQAEEDIYEYYFSVEDEDQSYAGESCAVSVVYEAAQIGYSHGEAFYDTEVDSFTLLGEHFGTPPLPVGSAEIVINEIRVNPSSGIGNSQGKGGAWLELYNTGSESVDVSGWLLENSKGDEHVISGPAGIVGSSTAIQPGGYLVVKTNKDFFSLEGDTVTLFSLADESGAREEVDSYVYTDGLIAKGKSTGLCPNGTGEPTGPLKKTRGSENDCDTAEDSGTERNTNITNNNGAEVVNEVVNVSNTGGNGASGEVTTGDASNTVNIVNEVNTNQTTISGVGSATLNHILEGPVLSTFGDSDTEKKREEGEPGSEAEEKPQEAIREEERPPEDGVAISATGV